MKIDLCLVASDLNTDYLDFFPLVLKKWNDIVGIDVKLILISEHVPEYLNNYKDNIILFKPVVNIPSAFQAQCIRILYPCLFIDKNIIISDMDLIPLNKTYYVDNITKYNNESFIIYRNVLESINQYPICFCLANSQIWKEIFNINTQEDIINTLKQWYSQLPENDYKISNVYSLGWSMDQLQLFYSVNKWNKNIIKLNDNDTGFKRLDRILNDDDIDIKIRHQKDINYITNNKEQIKEKINNGVYSDFHLPRPYSKHNCIFDYLFVNTTQIIDYKFTDDDIIITDKYLKFCNDNIIQYIKTDYFKLGTKFLWRDNLHPVFNNSKILVSGHSDYEIDKNIFYKYNKYYDKWFSVNVNYENNKLIPLPLGITNYTNESDIHPILGNTQIILDVLKNNYTKEYLLYMNFNINTHYERPNLYFTFKNYDWCHEGIISNTIEGRKRFLEDINKSKFVLCPRGNGIDTHRLWETLYMKSIPIVKYHITHSNLIDLPILFINDWTEINKEFLENKYEEIINKYWNMDKLKISYWLNYIKDNI
jgi:hypothetical protein